jgi:hypothetical protein
MHFSFVLLLALGAVIDPHVELRHADVEVESHKEALMEVMVLCKLRPTAFEVLLTGGVIPNLHFIGSSSSECSRRTASRSSRQSINLVIFFAVTAESHGIARR